jgi:hypothetical protein
MLACLGCASEPRVVAEPPARPPRVTTAWQQRCVRTLENLRAELVAFDPALRDTSVELDDVQEQVSLTAMMFGNSPSIRIYVTRTGSTRAHDWKRHGHVVGELSEIAWHRVTSAVTATITLANWEPERWRKVEHVLLVGVEPCIE